VIKKLKVKHTLMMSCLLLFSNFVPVWCWCNRICCRVSLITGSSWSTSRRPVMLTKLWRKSSKSRVEKSCKTTVMLPTLKRETTVYHVTLRIQARWRKLYCTAHYFVRSITSYTISSRLFNSPFRLSNQSTASSPGYPVYC